MKAVLGKTVGTSVNTSHLKRFMVINYSDGSFEHIIMKKIHIINIYIYNYV